MFVRVCVQVCMHMCVEAKSQNVRCFPQSLLRVYLMHILVKGHCVAKLAGLLPHTALKRL